MQDGRTRCPWHESQLLGLRPVRPLSSVFSPKDPRVSLTVRIIFLGQFLCFLLFGLRSEQGTILEDSYLGQVPNAGKNPESLKTQELKRKIALAFAICSK